MRGLVILFKEALECETPPKLMQTLECQAKEHFRCVIAKGGKMLAGIEAGLIRRGQYIWRSI